MRFLLVFGLVATLVGAAAPASAQEGQQPQIIFDVPPPVRSPADAELFALDAKIFDRAVQAKSLAELAPLQRELNDVHDHVPASFRLFQQRPGQIIVRADRDAGAAVGNAMAKAMLEADPKTSVKISFEKNVYGFAGLALASLAMERKDYARAVAVLGSTASFQPDNPKVIDARGQALAMAGRLPEALSVYLVWRRDYALQAELSPSDTAMILRGIGFVMTEQKRYADAEGAYQDLLKVDPKNKTALDALKRIAQLRKAPPAK